MKHERNVEGLRQNAQRKKQEAIKKTDAAIQQLNKEGRPINFKTVAEMAGVSTAWLYKETSIKTRIEALREQGTKKQKPVAPGQKATDASKDAKYQALKQRLQKIEAENRGLREHLEAIHGRQRVLADENEVQRREIERLTKLLEEAKTKIESLTSALPLSRQPSQKEIQITSLAAKKVTKSEIDSDILSALEELGIQRNSTLNKALKSASKQEILQAIGSLKEAISKKEVRNRSGFLVAAIENSWSPNQDYQEKVRLDVFNEWFPLAKAVGLVTASMRIEGVQHVLTTDEAWIPFSAIYEEYPLERLKNLLAVN